MTSPDLSHRQIRSFVLRQGRTTEGQQRAFDELWPRFGIDGSTPVSSPTLFDNDQPLQLEIGFGNGEALLAAALRQPDHNFVGIEVHRPGVGHLLRQAELAGIGNLRVLREDAMTILRQRIPAASLNRVMLFFPDPWHKTRRHKRRIVNDEFVFLCAQALGEGGIVHMATDRQDYAGQMLECFSSSPLFVNLAGPEHYVPRPTERTLTRFEQRGHRLGHGVWDLMFRRVADDPPAHR